MTESLPDVPSPLMSLPEDMQLNIMLQMSLFDILRLEQTNSRFRELSNSSKGELMWSHKLDMRFPNAKMFKDPNKSYHDYYIDLAKTFMQLGFDPNDQYIDKIGHDVFSILFRYNNDISPVFRIVTQHNTDDSSQSYTIGKINLNTDLNISKYVLYVLIDKYQQRNELIRFLWLKLPIFDTTGELIKWLYQTYKVSPTYVPGPRTSRKVGDMFQNMRLLTSVPLHNLQYIISIYDPSKLKADLAPLIVKFNRSGGKTNIEILNIPQATRDYLIGVYNSLP